MLALARALGAQQNPLENVVGGGVDDRAHHEGLRLSPADPTDWTDRPEPFEMLAAHAAQPPTITLIEQGGRILPVGLGIGATQEENATRSPIRAAGRPPMSTVNEPMETTPGPAGTQGTSKQGMVMLVTTAAGRALTMTFGTQAAMSG